MLQATITPSRGIVIGALCGPTLTCIPVVSLTTSQGAPGQLATGPVGPVGPVAPVVPPVAVAPVEPVLGCLAFLEVLPFLPVEPLVPLLPVLPVDAIGEAVPNGRPTEPTSVSVPLASAGIASMTKIVAIG